MSTWAIHPIERFDAFASAWDRVNGGARGVPFLHPSFISQSLRAFGSGNESLAVLGPPGSERALAVVTPTGKGAWQTFQPAQLPLGAWVMVPGSSYADVLGSLIGSLPGASLMVGVTQQDPAIHPRPEDSSTLQSLDYIQTAWVDIEGEFDRYWEGRGKNLRTNTRKQRTKLEASSTPARLEEIRNPTEVAAAIADYGRLESAGWKSEGGTAIHPDNVQGRFYRAMLEDFCTRGTGCIYRYWFGDKVAAMDLCVESSEVQVVLKTAYDESQKQLSPASLMRYESMQGIFRQGRIKRVEFYGRVMEWHTRWTESSRTLFHVNAYRSGSLKWLHEKLK
jgi:CelD/BcsL family acetyltransferase involved in cellulose biosynthesis